MERLILFSVFSMWTTSAYVFNTSMGITRAAVVPSSLLITANSLLIVRLNISFPVTSCHMPYTWVLPVSLLRSIG